MTFIKVESNLFFLDLLFSEHRSMLSFSSSCPSHKLCSTDTGIVSYTHQSTDSKLFTRIRKLKFSRTCLQRIFSRMEPDQDWPYSQDIRECQLPQMVKWEKSTGLGEGSYCSTRPGFKISKGTSSSFNADELFWSASHSSHADVFSVIFPNFRRQCYTQRELCIDSTFFWQEEDLSSS